MSAVHVDLSSAQFLSSFLLVYLRIQELLRTVELVRTDINKNLRTSLGAMVVMDVHNRDTTEELANLGVGCCI